MTTASPAGTAHRRQRRRALPWAATVAAAALVLATALALRAPAPLAAPHAAGPVAVPMATVSLPHGLAAVADAGAGAAAGARALPSGRPASAAGVVTVDPGRPFTMVGLTCAPPGHEVVVWWRASADGRRWGPWYPASLEEAGDGTTRARAFSEAVWTGPARWLQVRARSADGGVVRLRDVRVVALDSRPGEGSAAAWTRRLAATLAGLFGRPDPALAMTGKPAIVSRAEWGADESLRSGSPAYAPVRVAFVHHTASGNSYSRSEAAAIVRGIYAYHTKALGWSDIGYNFLIDRYGVIYEGRHGGVARGVVGAHVLGFNTGSTGVALIGTCGETAPPAAATSALRALLAWKLDVHHVDPLARYTLTCGYGQKYATGEAVAFRAISGHRDANWTECPGDALYRSLGEVRRAVAATGQPKVYDPALDAAAFSPNGDGRRDRVTVSFRLSEAATWTVQARDAGGGVVWGRSGEAAAGEAVQVDWSGRDDAGAQVPDGAYRLVVTAANDHGSARPATLPVTVDTVPPVVTEASSVPDPFSPNGDGQDDATTVLVRSSEAADLRASVVDDDGAVVRRLCGWTPLEGLAGAAVWDGVLDGAAGPVAAPEGPATLRLELRDAARNVGAAAVEVAVDRTLGFPRLSRRWLSPNGDGRADDVALTFALTRTAPVEMVVTRGEATVRTLRLGRLGSGERAATWDGRDDAGAVARNGRYLLGVVARSPWGLTRVALPVTVDLYRPRLTVPDAVSAASGATARVAWSVRDPYSGTVRVRVTVTDGKGRLRATLDLGWVRQGTAQTLRWKPPARGRYTLTFSARDRAGNDQAAPAATVLRVR